MVLIPIRLFTLPSPLRSAPLRLEPRVRKRSADARNDNFNYTRFRDGSKYLALSNSKLKP